MQCNLSVDRTTRKFGAYRAEPTIGESTMKVRKLAVLLGAVVALAAAVPSQAQDTRAWIPMTFTNFVVSVNGTNKVASVAAPASGSVIAWLRISPVASNICYNIGAIATSSSAKLNVDYAKVLDTLVATGIVTHVISRDCFEFRSPDPLKGPFLTQAIYLCDGAGVSNVSGSVRIDLGIISGK
jgi:hypothetical protein